MAAATLVEVAVDIWVAASVGADSVVVVATVEVLAVTAVDTAAEPTEAVITAARIPAAMQAGEGTAAHTQAEVPLLPGRGRGKAARARRGTRRRVGTDSREITVR
jgi:hypothetical protein